MSRSGAIVSERFVYRAPTLNDAQAIFERYASKSSVCRYVGWPRHTTVDDTRKFLEFAAGEWERWPVGPLLIIDRHSSELVGSTGLAFVSANEAGTGYVVAEPFWGRGIASEALQTMRRLASDLAVQRLFAVCHPEHKASRRVLEKAAFTLDSDNPDTFFPNLEGGITLPAVCYSCEPRESQS